MNFDYIKVCPLCRKEDSSEEFSTILIGATKHRSSGDRYRRFEDLHTINCCKECGERLTRKIADEIADIMFDASSEYSKEKKNNERTQISNHCKRQGISYRS